MKRYQRTGAPNVVYTLAREKHAFPVSNNKGRIHHSFLYSDGFGRELQTKVQAEPGPIYDTDGNKIVDIANPRWVGTGTKVFNNKAKEVQQYEPFFSQSHHYAIEQHGVSPIIFYDPLERVVCTLHPNHTYEKVVFDPWRQETWDANDTVLLLPDQDKDISGYVSKYITGLNPAHKTWYDQRIPDRNNKPDIDAKATTAKEKAALKTEAHAGTPTLAYIDSLGRPFLTIQDNGPADADKYKTHVKLDIEGNDKVITDPRVIEAFIHTFDIAGRKLKVDSQDAGIKINLPDITGEIPWYLWDANGNEVKTDYDTERELKKKYGVTYQHTFVQVDAQGNQIKKWGGSNTLSAVLSQIQ